MKKRSNKKGNMITDNWGYLIITLIVVAIVIGIFMKVTNKSNTSTSGITDTVEKGAKCASKNLNGIFNNENQKDGDCTDTIGS